MSSRRGILVKFVLALAVALPSRAEEPPDFAVFVDIDQSCAAVGDVALPWLKHRSVNVGNPDRCDGRNPCLYFLDSSKLRSANGFPILNANWKYVNGGKWYSSLTAPNVSDWVGRMELTMKNERACTLALVIYFGTTVSEATATSTYSEQGGTVPGGIEFDSKNGPLGQSNHRLEREYAQAIADRVARIHGGRVTSKAAGTGKSRY